MQARAVAPLLAYSRFASTRIVAMDTSPGASRTANDGKSRWALPWWGRLASECVIWYLPLGVSFNLIEAFDVDMPAWFGHVFIGTWIGWAAIWLAAFLVILAKGQDASDS